MSDLFIIGNGFDRAHGMETSYHAFHQFIKDNCKNMPYTGVVELVSQDSENKIDGMIVYEPVEYLDFFQIIIDQTDGPDWKNFEDALGRLEDFAHKYLKVESGEIRPFELMRKLGMSKTTFYRYVSRLH